MRSIIFANYKGVLLSQHVINSKGNESTFTNLYP